MSHDFVAVTCCQCGVVFGLPRVIETNRRQIKGSFWCPNGHSLTYGDTELDRTRRERDNLKQQQARLQQEVADAQATAARAETREKRLKQRASQGTCPCCKRTFTELQRHMHTKHPEFVAGNVTRLTVKAP